MPTLHRFSLSIVVAAFAAVGAVFLFARPEYHPRSGGRAISGTAYPAPAHGWTWKNGVPGYRFGVDEAAWNFARLEPRELAGARHGAARVGIDARSLRPLRAVRLSEDALFALVAGADAGGKTCLGTVVPRQPPSFWCPGFGGARRLGRQVAFVVVAARPPQATKVGNGHGFTHSTLYPLFLLVATRGDVKRVVVTSPHLRARFYDRRGGWWGTFDGTPGDGYVVGEVPPHPWRARLDFLGAHRRLATLRLRLDRPSNSVIAVRAAPASHS